MNVFVHSTIVWNTNYVPICVWQVLKAWCLLSLEKIKDAKMRHAIFDCLYLVMFMSINLGETIELFKACGREKVVECLIALSLVIHGLNIFGLIIANLLCNLFISNPIF
jgi:Na+/glutamate symporter